MKQISNNESSHRVFYAASGQKPPIHTTLIICGLFSALLACDSPANRVIPRALDASQTEDAANLSDGSMNADASVSPMDAETTDARVNPDADIVDSGQVDSGPPPTQIRPDQAGNDTWTRQEETVQRDSRRIPIVSYIPDGNATAGLVVFVPGFQLDSRRYQPLVEHLASHGFIVMRTDPPDPLLSVSHVEMADDIEAVLDWALDPQRSFNSRIDASKIATMGHSLGGKVATMVAYQDSRVSALLGLDPVNGGHPQNGFTTDLPDILPTQVSGLRIPIGLMGETTDDGTSGGGQACAPADGNFTRFYDASQASSWTAEWDIAGADHMDFVDDTSLCLSCGFCQNGSANKEDVLLIVRTLSAAFFRFHFEADTSMLPWLTGSKLNSIVSHRSRP